MSKSVWVHHDEGAELFGLRKEWTEFCVGQLLAIDVGQDLHTLQF